MQETYTTQVTAGGHTITMRVNERTGSAHSIGNEGIHGKLLYNEDSDTFTASTLNGYASEAFPSERRALQWLITRCLEDQEREHNDRNTNGMPVNVYGF